jgi:hypothetical protein
MINILGVNYKIEKHDSNEDQKLESANGYCETYSKKIVNEEIVDWFAIQAPKIVAAFKAAGCL